MSILISTLQMFWDIPVKPTWLTRLDGIASGWGVEEEKIKPQSCRKEIRPRLCHPVSDHRHVSMAAGHTFVLARGQSCRDFLFSFILYLIAYLLGKEANNLFFFFFFKHFVSRQMNTPRKILGWYTTLLKIWISYPCSWRPGTSSHKAEWNQ